MLIDGGVLVPEITGGVGAGVVRDAKLPGREVICEACDGHFKAV